MAEKVGGFPIMKKKVAFKRRPAAFNKQASTSAEWKDSPTQEELVEIDSDSDSEGFVNGRNGNSSQGKTSAQLGNKSKLNSLKTNGKISSATTGKADSGKGGKGGDSGMFGDESMVGAGLFGVKRGMYEMICLLHHQQFLSSTNCLHIAFPPPTVIFSIINGSFIFGLYFLHKIDWHQ